jgi:hypothetical protein
LPERQKFLENRIKIKKEAAEFFKKNRGNVTKYVFENPTSAILISLMQLISAFVAECLCMLTISG